MTFDEYKSVLRENVVNVTFTKLNGEERVMKCTLIADKIPHEFSPKSLMKESETAIAVWDLDKDAWRAFRLDAVKEFAIT